MNQVKRISILSSLATVVLLAHLGLNAQSQKELNDAALSDDTWLITNKDYAGHRFVNLRQIDKSNVFDIESKPYEGKKALFHLETEGSVSVYASAVVTKDADSTRT